MPVYYSSIDVPSIDTIQDLRLLPPSSARDHDEECNHDDYHDQDAESMLSRVRKSVISSASSVLSTSSEEKKTRYSRWRHALGIALLLVTVVLWTTANFLASTIIADKTYSKPYFVTYINTAFFIIPLIPIILKHLHNVRYQLPSWERLLKKRTGNYTLLENQDEEEQEASSKPVGRWESTQGANSPSVSIIPEHSFINSQESVAIIRKNDRERLTVGETMKLGIEFSILWFFANYSVAACLEYTTVASATILSSTSSIWTLIVGAMIGVESFTIKRLFGVLASLTGIILISSIDISSENDKNRGSFPHKTQREIIIGDSLAFLNAVLYGFYTILMKKRIGDEGRVNMPLFFGFIGIFNILALWPGLFILHITGIERFELPPTGRVVTIVLVNSASSLVADYCWAFAMLLTSPLVVTVGSSLTIPFSIIGQMILDGQNSSVMYWIGAGIVFLSFTFVNHEESKDKEEKDAYRVQHGRTD